MFNIWEKQVDVNNIAICMLFQIKEKLFKIKNVLKNVLVHDLPVYKFSIQFW